MSLPCWAGRMGCGDTCWAETSPWSRAQFLSNLPSLVSYSRDAGAWPRAAHPQDGGWDQGTATAGHPRCSHVILAWDVLPQGTLLYFPLPFVVSSVVSNSDDCRVCVASIVFFFAGAVLGALRWPMAEGQPPAPQLAPWQRGRASGTWGLGRKVEKSCLFRACSNKLEIAQRN